MAGRALGSGKTWGLGVDQPRMGGAVGREAGEPREQRVPQRPPSSTLPLPSGPSAI